MNFNEINGNIQTGGGPLYTGQWIFCPQVYLWWFYSSHSDLKQGLAVILITAKVNSELELRHSKRRKLRSRGQEYEI